jgi:hypothetical protein
MIYKINRDKKMQCKTDLKTFAQNESEKVLSGGINLFGNDDTVFWSHNNTLLEKPSVTQDQNKENYTLRIDWASMLLTDFSDRSMWMMEFYVTHMFWSCVTLSLFKRISAYRFPFT